MSLGAGLVLIALAAVPLSPTLSLYLALALMAALAVLGVLNMPAARLAFVTVAAWVVIRYLIWRFDTLPLDAGMASALAAALLLAAEMYGGFMLLTGLFLNAHPLRRRPEKLPERLGDYPTVDVFIPTYSEPVEVVKPTLLGALSIRYPKDKLRVYVCDDGYPRSQNPATDPSVAIELARRAEALRALCAQFGATYLTRADNAHAKSGNLNSAMRHSTGELVLVLDADHVPTSDILQNTVGFFIQDPGLAFVQTPHFLLNGDPVEKNLQLHNLMPAENEMFYRSIQPGLDLWNASFFCGSAAVIRRSALQDIGGFATESITEDALSSVKMHARGWRSAYLDVPMVAGLQPESFSGFVTQRLRWAMGMMQIFVKANPLLVPGLSPAQRLSYLSIIAFWFFPFARSVFFLAPVLDIVLGLKLYPVGFELFVAQTLPYLVAILLAFNKLYGKTRRLLFSELYETLQAFFALPALLSTLLSPSKPTFKVTPKGERHDKEHLSPLSWPFYIVYASTVLALVWGVVKVVADPALAGSTWLSLVWALFNLLLLNAALGVLVEKVQRRTRPRAPVSERVELDIDGQTVPAVALDISDQGARVKIPLHGAPLDRVVYRAGHVQFDARVRNRRYDGEWDDLGLVFELATPEQQRAAVAYAYGSSERWARVWERRENHHGLLYLAAHFAWLGIKALPSHLRKFLTSG
jgi:cellulose synthase (UDP-forming)